MGGGWWVGSEETQDPRTTPAHGAPGKKTQEHSQESSRGRREMEKSCLCHGNYLRGARLFIWVWVGFGNRG
jgi:hypothetical protein